MPTATLMTCPFTNAPGLPARAFWGLSGDIGPDNSRQCPPLRRRWAAGQLIDLQLEGAHGRARAAVPVANSLVGPPKLSLALIVP